MSILPIYLYGQSVLRRKAKPVRSQDDELIKFVDDMFETMRKAGGIGLAANQVGAFQRVIVVDVSEMEETKDQAPIALINPEVLSEEGKCTMEEGCLSIPEVREEVDRPEVIRVRYKDLEFKDQELVASGLVARVIRHEIDHLNGVLFVDYLDPAKIKKDRNWLEKRCRKVMKYRHKVVAHRSTMDLTLTIEEIDEALDAVEEMLKKYYLLFTGAGLLGAEPAIQFDWQTVFTIPWIPPEPVEK